MRHVDHALVVPHLRVAQHLVEGVDRAARHALAVEGGQRFWLYREGLYDRSHPLGDDTAPRWFLHGLFA